MADLDRLAEDAARRLFPRDVYDPRKADEVTPAIRAALDTARDDGRRAGEAAGMERAACIADEEAKRLRNVVIEYTASELATEIANDIRAAINEPLVEVHLNTRGCKPMTPETGAALARMFQAVYRQASDENSAAGDRLAWVEGVLSRVQAVPEVTPSGGVKSFREYREDVLNAIRDRLAGAGATEGS